MGITESLYSRDWYNLVNQLCCLVAKLCQNSFVTPWTVAHQAPLSDFPGKNIGVGCYFLLQGILPIQGLNSSLLHWQAFFFFNH